MTAEETITNLQFEVERLQQRLSASAAALDAHRPGEAEQLILTSVQHTKLIAAALTELRDRVQQLELFP